MSDSDPISKKDKAMKKIYQKPTMTIVQLQQSTMLLQSSGAEEVKSFGGPFNYRGGDEECDVDEQR